MSKLNRALMVGLAVAAIGCNAEADVEKVPVGSDVQLTKDDGGVVQGKLTARDEKTVSVDTGPVTRSVPRERIADVRTVDPAKPVELPPMAKYREYTVPTGTKLAIELQSTVNTATSRVDEPVHGTLSEAVMVGDAEVLPAGSAVHGEVAAVEPAGKVKGRASVTINFSRVEARGESYPINARFGAVAPSTKKEDAKKIGIPAAGGAVIGAIIGGKKGAAIGAAIGGGAGTTAVLMTAGEEITLGRGANLSVVLAGPVDVKVPIKK